MRITRLFTRQTSCDCDYTNSTGNRINSKVDAHIVMRQEIFSLKVEKFLPCTFPCRHFRTQTVRKTPESDSCSTRPACLSRARGWRHSRTSQQLRQLSLQCAQNFRNRQSCKQHHTQCHTSSCKPRMCTIPQLTATDDIHIHFQIE